MALDSHTADPRELGNLWILSLPLSVSFLSCTVTAQILASFPYHDNTQQVFNVMSFLTYSNRFFEYMFHLIFLIFFLVN